MPFVFNIYVINKWMQPAWTDLVILPDLIKSLDFKMVKPKDHHANHWNQLNTSLAILRDQLKPAYTSFG